MSQVEESLRAGSCTEGLQWCRENGSRLRKIQSSFEFNLRVQEFVELVREQRLPAAISYASSHFEPWLETNAQQVRRAMALLAFLPGTSCQRYSDLYDPSRWAQLANQFREANFALFSLTPEPLLTLTMQAGLSALKTPACVHAPGKPSANPDCPACNPIFEKIAAPLPRALHVNSTLVCRIDGSVMNADNPPTMLPNNQIYSLGGTTFSFRSGRCANARGSPRANGGQARRRHYMPDNRVYLHACRYEESIPHVIIFFNNYMLNTTIVLFSFLARVQRFSCLPRGTFTSL